MLAHSIPSALSKAIELGHPVATNADQAAELIAEENRQAVAFARGWKPTSGFRSASDSGIVVRENSMGGLSVTFAGRPTIEYPARHFDNLENLLSLVALAAQSGKCDGIAAARRTIGGAA